MNECFDSHFIKHITAHYLTISVVRLETIHYLLYLLFERVSS